MRTSTDFTKGKIYFPLLKFASFIMLAMFLQTMYGAVDILVVSLYGNASDVSATATGGQLMQVIQQIVVGLSVGITISLGQKLGEKKPEECGKIVECGIFIYLLLSLIITPCLLFFSKDIAGLLNAPDEALVKTAQYIFICGTGSIFILFYNLLGAVFRGLGDSLTPLMTVAIACFCNIVLDLIFVVIFEMGVMGVAFATTLAQGISVISSLLIIRKRVFPFEVNFKNIKFHKEEGKKILMIGSPMGLQDGLIGFSFVAITSFVNTLGLIASAGLGLTIRVVGFIMLLPASLAQSVGACTAQNYGAKNLTRANKALIYSISTAFCISTLITYATHFHGDKILGILSNNPEIISAGWQALKVYGTDVLFTSFLFSLIGFCIGCGKTLFVMTQGFLGAFCIRIPLAYYFSLQPDASLFSITIATPIATVIQIIICMSFYLYLIRNLKKNGFYKKCD